MKTYSVNITTSDNTYFNFNNVKIEDLSEIIRLMTTYANVSSITINLSY